MNEVRSRDIFIYLVLGTLMMNWLGYVPNLNQSWASEDALQVVVWPFVTLHYVINLL